MKNTNKGFSLVELIVVIAIMAILIGVAVPVYSGYIEKTQEAKDEQFLTSLSHTAQLFAAENGLELEAVWVAPEVKEDKGVELVLQGGEVYDGDMDGFYAMLGGAFTFETIDKTQEIVYREDVLPDHTEENTGTADCQHEFVEAPPATCVKTGVRKCSKCPLTEIIPALGHVVEENGEPDRVVGNLHIYKCGHDGCDFVTIVPQGNQIG